jgi:uncharacterized protein (TIGR03435 family)
MLIIASAYKGMEEINSRGLGMNFDFRKIPESLLRTKFDINAVGEGDSQAMLRTLLAERFQLRTHTEIQEVPIYTLTVARKGQLGPGLRPSQHNCFRFFGGGGKRSDPDLPAPCQSTIGKTRNGARLNHSAGTMQELLLQLAQPELDLPLVDKTGLEGNFEWELAFSRQIRDPNAPRISEAFEDQLGLKIQSSKGPWSVIVIDHVQLPTPN